MTRPSPTPQNGIVPRDEARTPIPLWMWRRYRPEWLGEVVHSQADDPDRYRTDATNLGRRIRQVPAAVTAVGGLVDIGEDAMLLLPGFKFDLEGKPTMPDHHIERDLPYCGGADPQLDLARELLAKRIREANAAREPKTATIGAD